MQPAEDATVSQLRGVLMTVYQTTIELAGEPLAAVVTYERCPFDGHPVIYEVILSEAKIEITRALQEWQIANLESKIEAQIEAEIEAAITEKRIEQAEDRLFYRRAA